MQATQVKVPAVLATGIVCLAVGIGIGLLGATFFGYSANPNVSEASDVPPLVPAGPAEGPMGGGMPGGGMPGGGMPGGGMPGGGGGMGGPRGPSPKNQLASLVAKLELLTQESLTIRLSPEEKKQVAERLKGLDSQQTLADEDAKARLDALLGILKDHKEAFQAVGYRWPGERFSRPPDMPNPFKDPKNEKALSAIQDRFDPVKKK